MGKPRKDPSPLQKKKLQQEADSRCPFCGNAEAAPDSIGANAKARNYAKYLAEKLCEYRMKNKFFLSDEERKRETGSYMKVIWKGVKKHFNVTSYTAISLENKEKLFLYLQDLIEKTMQGRINRGKGYKSYLHFSEYEG